MIDLSNAAVLCVEELTTTRNDVEMCEIVERHMRELVAEIVEGLTKIAAASPTQRRAIQFAITELSARPADEATP